MTFAAVFMAGLLGSLHCVGMCRGLVAAVSRCHARVGAAMLAYHGARGLAYGILGVIAGTLGAGLQGLGPAFGLDRVAAQRGGILGGDCRSSKRPTRSGGEPP